MLAGDVAGVEGRDVAGRKIAFSRISSGLRSARADILVMNADTRAFEFGPD